MPAVWPDYAPIRADLELGADPDVSRTPFDDGSVRQAKVFAAGQLTRRVTAAIARGRLGDFRAWAREYAHVYFLIVDPLDGVPRLARVRGGVGGIRYRQTARQGAPTWEGEMVLEGPEARANRAATGAPSITGIARVGETLTAGASDVADADGLPAIGTWSWQWLRGAAQGEITGASAMTYDPVAADVGEVLRVRATFTDGAGFDEAVTSPETAAVEARS